LLVNPGATVRFAETTNIAPEMPDAERQKRRRK
jgi:hypothetical protein